jgi:hypothetical protein
MAEDPKEFEVEHAAEVTLSLHVGGSFPFKARLYEYPAAGGEPTPIGEERSGTVLVGIGKLERGTVRRFAWSVAIVSEDEAEQVINLSGRVLVGTKTIGTVKGTVTVKKPLLKCFVNVHVKGKGA